MQKIEEKRVRSLSQGNPLEEGTATHSSVLAWRILWTEKHGRLQSVGRKEMDMTEVPWHTHTGHKYL